MRWDLILYFIQLEYEHLTIIAVCVGPQKQRKASNERSRTQVCQPCPFTVRAVPAGLAALPTLCDTLSIATRSGKAMPRYRANSQKASERASAWQSQRGDVAKCTKKSVQIIINMGSIADAEDKSNM